MSCQYCESKKKKGMKDGFYVISAPSEDRLFEIYSGSVEGMEDMEIVEYHPEDLSYDKGLLKEITDAWNNNKFEQMSGKDKEAVLKAVVNYLEENFDIKEYFGLKPEDLYVYRLNLSDDEGKSPFRSAPQERSDESENELKDNKAFKVLVEERDMVVVFDEVDEVLEDLAFSDEEVVSMLPQIRGRLRRVQNIMNDIVTQDMYDKYKESI